MPIVMMRNVFNIIRWPNLLMLAGIQLFIYYRLLDPAHSSISYPDLALLILITILIGASGYVINDYYDSAIDPINKPQKWIAGNMWTLDEVKKIYLLLVFTGFCLSIWLASRLDLIKFIFIYPLAITALWLYSYALKCRPVIGNIWVALFCAGVVGIVALPDLLSGKEQIIKPELLYYMVFAFLATWLREIIKDIEDMEGDAAANCKTAVVRYGLKFGKIMMIFVGLLLVTSLLIWDNQQTNQWIDLVLTVLQGFTISAMAMVLWAKTNVYYHHASTVMKLVMTGGTMMLVWV